MKERTLSEEKKGGGRGLGAQGAVDRREHEHAPHPAYS